MDTAAARGMTRIYSIINMLEIRYPQQV